MDERKLSLLEDFALKLHWSWGIDSKDPTSYPMNTDGVLLEMREALREHTHRTDNPGTKKIKLRRSRPPKRFADLFHEGLIKTVYEQQHSSSYEEALRLAGARSPDGSSKAFYNIMKAAEADYYITSGGDHLTPKPRIHLLHRELLDIAAQLELDSLTNQGLEEFFEDVCPCAKKHNAEAIRKLRKRKKAGSGT